MKSEKLRIVCGLAAVSLLALAGCSKDNDEGDVIVPVTSVTITEGETYSLAVDGTHTFRATVAPDNATHKTVTWSSSAAAILSIDSRTGAATGVAAGTATVTATAGGRTATCTVTVAPNVVAVTGITLPADPVQLQLGGQTTTHQLVPTIAPEDATNKSVSYISSYPDVATVSAEGLVTAVAGGKTTITATTADGEHTATSNVYVGVPLPDAKWSYYAQQAGVPGTERLEYDDPAHRWGGSTYLMQVNFLFGKGAACESANIILFFDTAAEAQAFRDQKLVAESKFIDVDGENVLIYASEISGNVFSGKTQSQLTALDIPAEVNKVIDQLFKVPQGWAESGNTLTYTRTLKFNQIPLTYLFTATMDASTGKCTAATLNVSSPGVVLISRVVNQVNAETKGFMKPVMTVHDNTSVTFDAGALRGNDFTGKTKSALMSMNPVEVVDGYINTSATVNTLFNENRWEGRLSLDMENIATLCLQMPLYPYAAHWGIRKTFVVWYFDLDGKCTEAHGYWEFTSTQRCGEFMPCLNVAGQYLVKDYDVPGGQGETFMVKLGEMPGNNFIGKTRTQVAAYGPDQLREMVTNMVVDYNEANNY